MEGKIEDDLMEVTRSFIMDDIKDFAASVDKLGKEYNIGPVQKWAEKITAQAISFDMEHLPVTLDYFPELIKEVKKLLD